MTTKELIQLLKEKDPDGNRTVYVKCGGDMFTPVYAVPNDDIAKPRLFITSWSYER